MPELPEVETVMRTVGPPTVGRPVRSVYASRLGLHGGHPVPGAALRRGLLGRRIHAWERRGKYLLAHVGADAAAPAAAAARAAGAPSAPARPEQAALVVHLGMSGRLLVVEPGEPRPAHTHLELGFEGDVALRFVDPRRFGQVHLVAAADLPAFPPLAVLGPEPLGRRFGASYLTKALAGSARPIKNALLDQALVAGVGNIYASEACFRARIDPRRAAGSLDPTEVRRLARAVRQTLREAIEHCGTTFSDYRDGWGTEGRYQSCLFVFGRVGEPCRRCRTPIVSFRQAGRTTFACPRCQL